MIQEGLLLGLSTGSFCAISCAPVAIPFIFSEKIDGWRQNAGLVGMMLLGRLAAYLGVGFLVGALGGYAVRYLDPEIQRRLLAVSNALIGGLMIAAGLMHNFPGLKFCRKFQKVYRPGWGSWLYGFFTGLNICPPFFMAASRVFGTGNGLAGMVYFGMFFLGTSVYFLPLLGVHLFKDRLPTVRMVARLALILLGAYFLLFQGIFYGSVGRFR
jgi:sulfite exporter TauE/SafE